MTTRADTELVTIATDHGITPGALDHHTTVLHGWWPDHPLWPGALRYAAMCIQGRGGAKDRCAHWARSVRRGAGDEADLPLTLLGEGGR